MPRKGQEKLKLSVLPCWGFNQQPTPWLYHSAMPELAEVPWVKILTRMPIARVPSKLPQSPSSKEAGICIQEPSVVLMSLSKLEG